MFDETLKYFMNYQHAHRKLYPRKAKVLVNYKLFNEEGIKEMTETNTAEMTEEGAVGGEDEMNTMTDKDFEEFKGKIQSLDFTDEETVELMKKLKDIKKKEKVKKRKLALKVELEKRVKELEELEEMENDEKKEKKKRTKKDKEKGKDKVKKETKQKVIGEEFFKNTSLDIKDLRTNKNLQKVVEKHMKKLLNNNGSDTDSVSSESDVSGESKVNSSIDSSSDYSSSSEQESNSDSGYKKKAHKHKKETKKYKKKVRSGIKDRPHDKVKVKTNWPQSELKYEFTN